MGRPTIYLLALVVFACTPPQQTDTIPAVPQAMREVHLEGTPRVVGSAPMSTEVVLQDDEGRSTRLSGPLTREISSLTGAKVEVWGHAADGTVEATRYRIVAVGESDGSEPIVMGVVERGADGRLQLRTETGDIVHLGGATDRLEPGQKAWVRGPMTLEVRSLGIIKP